MTLRYYADDRGCLSDLIAVKSRATRSGEPQIAPGRRFLRHGLRAATCGWRTLTEPTLVSISRSCLCSLRTT